MKKIAVIMSTYNGERFLRCQIDSILNQELEDVELELIVRDDGSTDKSLAYLRQYQDENNNIKVVSGINIGYIRSFIELLRYVKNEDKYDYIALADQDDRWDHNKLQCAINEINKVDERVPFLYQATTRVVNEQLEFERVDQRCTRPISFYNTIIQTFAPGHTYVFNKALLQELPQDIECSKLYGHDALLTNMAVIFGKIYFDNQPHNDYRQHGTNQIGTSTNGLIGWISIHLKKIKHGEGKIYSEQIRYITKLFKHSITDEEYYEIDRFFSCQKNIFTRTKYALFSKLYRQGKLETLAFKVLYILGGYNI